MSRECPTPHKCPHCRCEWDESHDTGYVNKDAPFYPLVEYVDGLSLVHSNVPPSARFGPNTSGGGTASTARLPARPTEEVRQ